VIVVSNTSPIINLAAVGQLQLLRQLYGQITIPQAVYREIVILGAGQSGAAQVESSDWIEMRQVSDQALVASLQLKVDEGEAEAIALAAALNADLAGRTTGTSSGIASRAQIYRSVGHSRRGKAQGSCLRHQTGLGRSA
jgi:predicted nucleic acid-binding protein